LKVDPHDRTGRGGSPPPPYKPPTGHPGPVGRKPANNDQKPGKHAGGGWVGLNGPELSWLGESGPEYVVPHHKLGSTGGHGHDIYLDGIKVGKALDHGSYWHSLATSGSGNRG
jgi:hypothetical protein